MNLSFHSRISELLDRDDHLKHFEREIRRRYGNYVNIKTTSHIIQY